MCPLPISSSLAVIDPVGFIKASSLAAFMGPNDDPGTKNLAKNSWRIWSLREFPFVELTAFLNLCGAAASPLFGTEELSNPSLLHGNVAT